MLIRNAALAFALAVVSFGPLASSQAQDVKGPANAAPGIGLSFEGLVGRSVSSADGVVLGNVTSMKSLADGKGMALFVTSPTDGKVFTIPSDLVTISETNVVTKMTAADLGKTSK